jgi:hypothetical protein
MRYPSKDDYLKAVQRAESFTVDELAQARFVLHPVWQIPTPASGASAVVFRAVVDGVDEALRFLIRPDVARRDRYEALQRHFVTHGLAGDVALSRWMDDAIEVNGRSWPVVRMQWVTGTPLHHQVDQLVERRDTQGLADLAAGWRQLLVRLQATGFAHGDLQHGNVLVDEEGTLRLVDFDCSWIAAFAGQPPPAETGHRNYQPENRPWGRWMDTFSGLVVYLSLRTLARNPSPWHELSTGENLLFARDDFRPPFDTPAWATVSAVRDPELDELAARLRNCCAAGWTANSGLDALIAPRTPSWWELTGAVPRPVPVPASDGAVAAPPAPTPTPPSPPLPRSPSSPVSGPSPGEADASGEPWWEHAEEKPAATPPRPRRIGQAIVLGLVVFVVLVAVGAVLAPTPAGPVIALALGILTTVLVMCVPRS